MPSGAKKRKAAKKKQEKGASATSSANPSSTASSTHGDEDLKHHESDGEHNTEGEEEVVEKSEKSAEDLKNGGVEVDKRASMDEVVQIEREYKSGDGFDAKKGDSSSSASSSGSDDESRENDKHIVVIENAPVVDSVALAASLPVEPTQVTHTTSVSKLDDSVGENAREVVSKKISMMNEEVSVGLSASADSSLSADVVEDERKENGEGKSSSLEENERLPEVVKELAPESIKNEVTDGAATSEHENKENLLISYNVTKDDATKDTEVVKISDDLGSSDGQAFITSARQVQTTSWKSCCGLFEAFTGSSR